MSPSFHRLTYHPPSQSPRLILWLAVCNTAGAQSGFSTRITRTGGELSPDAYALELMLASPNGTGLVFFAFNCGASESQPTITLNLSDTASGTPPDSSCSNNSTYKPYADLSYVGEGCPPFRAPRLPHLVAPTATPSASSRWRIVRQSVTESLVLAMAGGALGLWIGSFGTKLLIALFFRGSGYVPISISPDLRVLAFTLLLSCAAALLFGVLPATRTTSNLSLVIRGASPGIKGSRIRVRAFSLGPALIVAQVALSVIVLVSAGAFARTLSRG